jgi:hypothetical protein
MKLSKEVQAWLDEVECLFIVPTAQKKLLILAARAWDRCQAAQLHITEHGQIVVNSHGTPSANPSIRIERESAFAFGRLVRLAGLLDVPAPAAPKPPSSPRGRKRKMIEDKDNG